MSSNTNSEDRYYQRILGASDGAQLVVPPLKEAMTVARNRAFSVMALTLWNSLPNELRKASSLLSLQ